MTRPLGGPVDVPFVILHRLEELGLEQQELARAAHVTESYISQLLTRRKAPPAPNRTDIYDRMDKFLKLPSGELAKLADLQRKEELKRELGDEPAPLFHEVRELILRKCDPDKENTSARSLKSSPSASSNASSPRRCWTWSSAWRKTNSRMTTGSVWWLGSVAAAMRRCGSSCSSSSIRTSSTCPLRTASRSWIR